MGAGQKCFLYDGEYAADYEMDVNRVTAWRSTSARSAMARFRSLVEIDLRPVHRNWCGWNRGVFA
ncbi:MAG: hypothetical protein ACLR8P_07385 [Clostridium fessum]